MANLNKRVLNFVIIAFVFFSTLVVLSALRQGWFAPHKVYHVEFESADGLHTGAQVTLMGLKIGQVEEVEISTNKKIQVEIRIQKKYSNYITKGVQIRMARPFIIGDKEIMIIPEAGNSDLLTSSDVIQGYESLELTDLLSGGRMGPYLNTLNSLFEQLKIIVEGNGGKNSSTLSMLFNQAYVSLKAIESVAFDVRKMRKDVIVTDDTKKLVKQLADSTESLKSIMQTSKETLPVLKNLTAGANGMMPQVTSTLSELVLTLQAMQRSFFLRSAVKDIRKEQKEMDKNSRLPASEIEVEK